MNRAEVLLSISDAASASGVAAASAGAESWTARLGEFLLVGGATLLLLPVSWWLQRNFAFDDAEFAIGFVTFHAAFVINDPHFSVTYLLFYKNVRERSLGRSHGRAQRMRYILAGFVGPAVLAIWAGAAIALSSAVLLGWLIQLMFLLVGWHYVKQAFGVLVVLGQRRGQTLTQRERGAFSFHCYAAWAYAWANPAVPAGFYEEKGVVYWALARPPALEHVAAIVLAVSALLLGATLIAKWQRERRLLPFAPLAAFLISVWCWTIYSAKDPLLRYAIPALHSLQYLYFVWLMQRNRARAEEGPPAFGRPSAVRLGLLAVSALALGFLALRGVPAFLDELLAPSAPGALGATPFLAAFFVVINIHHYLMDAVIWRRENPDTRYLTARSAD